MNNDSDRLQGFNKIPQSPHKSLTFSLCEIIQVLARWKDFNERRFRDAHVSVPRSPWQCSGRAANRGQRISLTNPRKVSPFVPRRLYLDKIYVKILKFLIVFSITLPEEGNLEGNCQFLFPAYWNVWCGTAAMLMGLLGVQLLVISRGQLMLNIWSSERHLNFILLRTCWKKICRNTGGYFLSKASRCLLWWLRWRR